MAYCRFSNGDVYIFEHVKGFLECCSCRLLDNPGSGEDFTTSYRQEMLNHIYRHKVAGHKVGYGAIKRLKRDIKELGDIVE